MAWELLAEAAKFDPDDAPMNRARAELAPRVADFVVYLDRAQRQAAAGAARGFVSSVFGRAGYLSCQSDVPRGDRARVRRA